MSAKEVCPDCGAILTPSTIRECPSRGAKVVATVCGVRFIPELASFIGKSVRDGAEGPKIGEVIDVTVGDREDVVLVTMRIDDPSMAEKWFGAAPMSVSVGCDGAK